MSETKAIKTSRRTFLLAAGAGGAATVAAIAAKLAPAKQASAPPDSQDKRAGKGYQDTAHIRSYYRTTEV
ncbi:MAG: hypothetical protein WCR74_09685 [Betaproteobacteria bacterium]|nr:hypothetical protein [Pseudomonadota bacterium]